MSMSRPGESQHRPVDDGPNPVVQFLSKHWIPLVLIAAAAVFIAQNRATTGITLLWIDVRAPLWVVLAVLFVGGFAAGLMRGRRRRRD